MPWCIFIQTMSYYDFSSIYNYCYFLANANNVTVTWVFRHLVFTSAKVRIEEYSMLSDNILTTVCKYVELTSHG